MADYKLLYDGTLGIDYGQFSFDVMDDDDLDMLDPDGVFQAQQNGICGAAQRGKVLFFTGIQTGSISIRVELHEIEPILDESFDEIVEASFLRSKYPVSLCDLYGEEFHNLELPRGQYRLRYSIRGMDLDYDDDNNVDTPVKGNDHLIQLWPKDKDKDKIIKVTSDIAKHFHKEQSDPDGDEINDIENLYIVFTGKMSEGTREDMEEMAEEQDAVVQKSVNSKTDILVIGEKVGEKKLSKAKELGVEIITESEFLSRIESY